MLRQTRNHIQTAISLIWKNIMGNMAHQLLLINIGKNNQFHSFKFLITLSVKTRYHNLVELQYMKVPIHPMYPSRQTLVIHYLSIFKFINVFPSKERICDPSISNFQQFNSVMLAYCILFLAHRTLKLSFCILS